MLADYAAAPIPDAERALFAFIEKVNRDASSVCAGDIERLHAAGWTDEAIYDAVMVCGLFNFYNRWVDAAGVHEMAAEAHKASGRRMAARGYLMTAGGAQPAAGSEDKLR